MDAVLARLMVALRRRRVASASELMSDMSVSQPTLARSMKALGNEAVIVGKARSTRYALARRVRGLPLDLPVYRIDDKGAPFRIATLRALDPEGSFLYPTNNIPWPLDDKTRSGIFSSLPYFIFDTRPQGFLGRSFARQNASRLQIPEDPARWSDDDVLAALALGGEDLPGDIVLGDAALDAYQRHRSHDLEPMNIGARKLQYPETATRVLAGELPGSSAGGEFPKFTSTIQTAAAIVHVIVKFSPQDDTSAATRWSDLLIAEHHANAALHGIDVPASGSELLRSSGRMLLEVHRFDRIGAYGRRGLVSLACIDAELLGLGDAPWERAAYALHERGWISLEDRARIVRLTLFGRFIGNSDMRSGNLSFFSDEGRFRLAPVYDMLPMMFAPNRSGELTHRHLNVTPPGAQDAEEWQRALAAAIDYWTKVKRDRSASTAFREICTDCIARLQKAESKFL